MQLGTQVLAHGYDAGKQLAGRKRPITVDTGCLSLAVLVQAASVQDSMRPRYRPRLVRMQPLWADARYREPLAAPAAAPLNLRVEVSRVPSGHRGFVVRSRR